MVWPLWGCFFFIFDFWFLIFFGSAILRILITKNKFATFFLCCNKKLTKIYKTIDGNKPKKSHSISKTPQSQKVIIEYAQKVDVESATIVRRDPSRDSVLFVVGCFHCVFSQKTKHKNKKERLTTKRRGRNKSMCDFNFTWFGLRLNWRISFADWAKQGCNRWYQWCQIFAKQPKFDIISAPLFVK